jgi:hypothetical protein
LNVRSTPPLRLLAAKQIVGILFAIPEYAASDTRSTASARTAGAEFPDLKLNL